MKQPDGSILFCLLAALPACSSSAPVDLQAPPMREGAGPQGPALDPSGFLLGAPTAVLADQTPWLRFKDAGFVAAYTPAPHQPDFAALLTQHFPGVTKQPIQALSLGLDLIALEDVLQGQDVVLAVDQHGWVAFQFTVHAGEVGSGSLAPDIAAAKQRGDLDRTVFSFLLPQSQDYMHLLPAEQPSTRSFAPAALDLGGYARIQGLCMHLALYSTDLVGHGKVSQRPIPAHPRLFFALTRDFVTDASRPEWAQQASTSSIYRSQSAIENGRWTWSVPQVFRDHTALDIEPTDTIDGLAIDHHPDSELGRILFSLGPSTGTDPAGLPPPPEEQVLYTGPNPADPGGNPIKRRKVLIRDGNQLAALGVHLGSGRGLGDFCTKDPYTVVYERAGVRHWLRPPGAETFTTTRIDLPDDLWIARRRASADPKVAPSLSIAAYRHRDAQGKIWMRVCLSGPAAGNPVTATIHVSGQQPQPVLYSGAPLAKDFALPTTGNGHLEAWWEVTINGTRHVSPVAALRY